MTQTSPFLPSELNATDVLRLALTSQVYGAAHETPLSQAPRLSQRLGHQVLYKREDQQPIFSFKLRGAYNKMAQLSPAERASGVICASAGNHAQGVAFSAQALSMQALIVMPATTPEIKIQACRARGAEVLLYGDSFSDAESYAYELQRQRGLTFVHPYDDPLVLAGQGTIGLELLRQVPGDEYAVFVPVGGGGLIAGVASVLKAVRPDVRIIGVEPDDSDAMYQSLQAGRRLRLEKVGLFVDGVAVKQVGAYTFELTKKYVDDWVRVSTDEVCAAIKDVFDDTRAVMEPAGALAVAGLKKYSAGLPPGQTLVALTCGANMNFDRLRHVVERTEVGEQGEVIIALTLREEPGALRELMARLGTLAVTELNYRLSPGHDARVFLGLQLPSPEQRSELLDRLHQHGYHFIDFSGEELAKVHIRHMVGGRLDIPERLYAVTFPERAGALLEFLSLLPAQWNITLFNYRHQGTDHGRVLIALQGPEAGAPFIQILAQAGFPTEDRTEHITYQTFLR